MNQFVRQLCKQDIEPAVTARLTQYKLKGFEFDRLVLGRIVSMILLAVYFEELNLQFSDKKRERNYI